MQSSPLLSHDYSSNVPAVAPVRVSRAYPLLVYLRQTIGLFLALFLLTYIATCIYCQKFGDWFSKLSLPSGHRLNQSSYYGSCNGMNIATARDILVAVSVLAVSWFFGEILTRKFNYRIDDEIATGEAWQKKLDERDVAAGVAPLPVRRQAANHSASWNYKLREWKANKAKAKSKAQSGVYRRAVVFYIFFAGLALCTLLIVFAISPQKYSSQSISSMASNMFTIDAEGAYDVVMLSIWLLEIALFLTAVLRVTWPEKFPEVSSSAPRHHIGVVESARPTQGRDMFASADEVAVSVTSYEDETRGLVPNVAVLIACHKSTITPERKATFMKTIRNACSIFPAYNVFVCDNGPYDSPVDRTEEVCAEVSRELYPDGSQAIQYLFLGEGNKSHAMYWASEMWIPALVNAGKIPDPEYALVIDDDVPLPLDLQVPLRTLSAHPDIKAISYAIEAATESGNYSTLVALQDAEYKIVGTMKQLQASFGTAMYCHGAIGLWRRDVLGKKVLWDHDTVFHGEDMYMGLLLHRLRRNYKIDVAARAVVPTYAPEDLLMLFKQRTRSWDLCSQRKVYSLFKEFCLGWCTGGRSIALKPFLFYEVACVFIDWLRVFLIVGLLFRNWFSFVILMGFFYVMQWAELILFNCMVLSRRSDLRIGVVAFILFPFYKTLGMFFRVYAVLVNVLVYSTWSRKNISIHQRERYGGTVPPVPPADTKPNWYNIWIESDGNAEDVGAGAGVGVGAGAGAGAGAAGAGAGLATPTFPPGHAAAAAAVPTSPPSSSFDTVIRGLIAPLAFHEEGDRLKFAPIVEGYTLLRQISEENTIAQFTAQLTAQGQGTPAIAIASTVNDLRMDFENTISQVIRHQNGRLMDAVGELLRTYAQSQSFLALNPHMLQALGTPEGQKPALLDLLQGNDRVYGRISQCLNSCNYPAHQDRVSTLKHSTSEVTRLLREATGALRS